jgi:AAA family ATP:ADP antiporter
LERAERSRRLAKLLRPIARVQEGEAVPALLLAFGAFLLLCAYYILKTAREPLILLGGGKTISGAELKAYAAAAQAGLLLAFVAIHDRLVNRLDRRRLVKGTVTTVVLCLIGFNLLGHLGVSVGLAYYLWLGVSTLVVVAQFWSLANDRCTPEQGERLFPLVAAGGSVGAIVGSAAAGWLLRWLGVLDLTLVAGALLVAYGVVQGRIERLPVRTPQPEPPRLAPAAAVGGLRLVRRTHYLTLLALMVVVATAANAHGEYILSRAVSAHAKEVVAQTYGAEAGGAVAREAGRAVVTKFYADFYSGVNLIGLFLQLFAVSPLFHRFGLARAIFVFPLVALASYLVVAAAPMFMMIAAAKMTENSTDYSLHNTVRQALFLPTSREAKYKAKAAIDGFFFRSGDVIAALVVFAGIHLLGLSVRGFAVINVLLVAVWLGVVVRIARGYRALSTAACDGAGAEDTRPRPP